MKKVFLLFGLLSSVLAIQAQEWTDITDNYVTNPRYENNDLSGWEGTPLGSYNPKNNAEHYQKNYNTYQTITGLTAGTYRISLNAFYRAGSPATDYEAFTSDNKDLLLASLYANSSVDTQHTALPFASSAALSSSLGGNTQTVGNNLYIPDNMEAADAWFSAGNYLISVECKVGEDGNLTIGIKKDETIQKDWTCLDNWKLEYMDDNSNNGGGNQTWIDVTDLYLQSPRFDNNVNKGWETSGWYSGRGTAVEMQEFFSGFFDFYQYISLPAGKYRLSVQGYFRQGDNNQTYNAHTNGSEDLSAFLYADDDENDYATAIASVFSEYLDEYVSGCWTHTSGNKKEYYPNTMESAAVCFAKGMYNDNILEFQAAKEGQWTIGIRQNNWNSNNWCLFDNFKLEYYSQLKSATGIQLSAETLEMAVDEVNQLHATILPEDATYTSVTWTSSDESVVTVDSDGNLHALKTGTAVITATTKDGTNLSAQCTITVIRNEVTKASIIINEIMVANVDMFLDTSFNYGGFVEFYNPTNTSASIGGIYVSDDASNLKKCHLSANAGAIPAHGFHTIWFDHASAYAPLQVNMKLKYDGGVIYISDKDGNLLVEQVYPPAISRTSYARTTDGGSNWAVTAQPTPGSSNNSSPFASNRLDPPVVDKDAQFFTGSLQVHVSFPSGATLRYTDDGTTPTLENGYTSQTGIINVDYTTNLRFRLFQDGWLPSAVVTRSYIYKEYDFQLPTISITGDYEDIYGDDHGVLARGNGNGRPGNGQNDPCNWNMDWDHPVNFEYIPLDPSVKPFSQEVDICASGGWSRAWDPKAFKLKSSTLYEGNKFMNYMFFQDKPFLRHKSLQIRNGGNDNNCRFRDPALQTIVLRSGLDVDAQSYQPVHHYINGVYKGVINMRETNNKHFALANWNIDPDEMDQFEMSPDSGYVQKAGDRVAWDQLIELSYNADNENTYQQIRQLLDIDEYINYMAVELYLGNWDWPQNNVKGYRDRNNGKFRFVLFDLDGSFSTDTPFTTFTDKQHYDFDNLRDLTEVDTSDPEFRNNRWHREIQFVTLFVNLFKNESFRQQFVTVFQIVGGSVFEPTRCQNIVKELAAIVKPEMSYRWESPDNTANQVLGQLSTTRQANMTNNLRSFSKTLLTGIPRQPVKLASNIADARILINNIDVPTGTFNGYLFAPAKFRVVTPAGYQFVGWSNLNDKSGAGSSTLISPGAFWYYYDQGSLDGNDWKSSVQNTWSSGNAPLGYFTSDANNGRNYQTFLQWGTDSNNKRPTYYFSKNVQLNAEPGSSDIFELNFTVDDGFVIYVNGQEAGRYNMLNGTPSFSSYSTQYAPGNPDTGTMQLSPSLFKKGDNTIAVEVHNCDNHSTDIYWDAELNYEMSSTSGQQGTIVSTEPEYQMPSSGNINLVAMFKPLDTPDIAHSESHPVKVNEVSASNSVYVNEYFKRNDWVELYNTTDQPVNVAGMYLSDNLSKPKKFQIAPAPLVSKYGNTVIQPHDFLIVWCDKLDPVDQLHASFKLAAEGGDVLLTSADETWCDTLSYIIHDGRQSVGLYPDGGTELYVMNIPTIGRSNTINSYDMKFDEPGKIIIPHTPDPIPTEVPSPVITPADGTYTGDVFVTMYVEGEDGYTIYFTLNGGEEQVYTEPFSLSESAVITAYTKDAQGNKSSVIIRTITIEDPIIDGIMLVNNGGLHIRYNGNALIIRTEDPTAITADIYSATGKTVIHHSQDLRTTASVSTASLPVGVYMATVRNADGDCCRLKFIKR